MTDGEQPPEPAVRGLRVLTLNVLALEHAEGRRRLEVLGKELRRLRPDVAALQEVTRIEGYDQVLDLLGPGYTVIDHPDPSPEGVGAALASRWPVRTARRRDLHVTPQADLPWAAVVVAEVLAPAPLGPLLAVHHKPNWQHGREYEREQQAVAAARFVEQIVGEFGHHEREPPVVLLGDFDAAPDAASSRFWTGRQSLDGTSVCYQDAWEAVHPGQAGHTFTPDNRLVRDGEMALERGRRIDYVMVRCGPHGPALEVTGCQRVLDQPVTASGPATTTASSPTSSCRRVPSAPGPDPAATKEQPSMTIQTSPPSTSLRAMSLNLFGHNGDWPARRQVLKAGLAQLRPDVLALQEAIADDTYDQAVELLGGAYHVAHQTRGLLGDGRHHGASVAGRWPIHAVHEVDLHLTPRTGNYSCGAVIAEVAAPEPLGRLLVACHGNSWAWWAEHERELQALAVVRRIEELVADDPAHVIVGGDFNATPDTSSMRFWTGRTSLDGTSTAYRDCWESIHGSDPGLTFEPQNPLSAIDEPDLDRGRRIDYVLVRCGDHGPTLRIADCRRVLDQPVGGVMASDHYGVIADLQLHEPTDIRQQP